MSVTREVIAPVITREAFIEAMEKVVEGREDYVYRKPEEFSSCVYTEDGETGSCLIGSVLVELGLPVYTNEQLVEKSAPMSAGELLRELYDVEDEKLLEAAQNAQYQQDNGESWGTVLADFLWELEKGER